MVWDGLGCQCEGKRFLRKFSKALGHSLLETGNASGVIPGKQRFKAGFHLGGKMVLFDSNVLEDFRMIEPAPGRFAASALPD